MKPTHEQIAAAAAIMQQFARDTKGTAAPSRAEAAAWSVWSALSGDGEPEHAFRDEARKARAEAAENAVAQATENATKPSVPPNMTKVELVDWANKILAQKKLPTIDESFGTKAEIIEHVEASIG